MHPRLLWRGWQDGGMKVHVGIEWKWTFFCCCSYAVFALALHTAELMWEIKWKKMRAGKVFVFAARCFFFPAGAASPKCNFWCPRSPFLCCTRQCINFRVYEFVWFTASNGVALKCHSRSALKWWAIIFGNWTGRNNFLCILGWFNAWGWVINHFALREVVEWNFIRCLMLVLVSMRLEIFLENTFIEKF